MKKVGILWIFVLVVVICIPSGLSFILDDQYQYIKNIITVDDEFGDADYTSIKEALNHSSPGDTIEVFSGTYYEHGINVTEDGISLIGIPYELGNGSDTGKPFINGQGLYHVIYVKAPNVTITGFHIENRGPGFWCIIQATYNANGTVISNNTLCYSGDSIINWIPWHATIINNTIRYAGYDYGIALGSWDTGSGHNFVAYNVIDHCPTGINIWGDVYDTVVSNRISNCTIFGIDIIANMNSVQYNTIENNAYGLHIYQSAFNRIKYNNFINNIRQAGFDQSFSPTGGNRFIQNYWGRPRILPYPIVGTVLGLVPWVQFDWRPAQEPYDIA